MSLLNGAISMFEPPSGGDQPLTRASLLNGAPGPAAATDQQGTQDMVSAQRAAAVARGLLDPKTDLATKAGLENAANQLAQSIRTGAPAQADPYDYTDRYNTKLSPAEEAAFQAWGKQQASQSGRNPAGDTYDYDMRGFWKSGQDFAANGHAGDQFKKPNHPTFSTYSQYNGVDGNQGGTWGGGQNGQPWTFTPSATNLQAHDVGDLQRYFNEVESGNRLIIPKQ